MDKKVIIFDFDGTFYSGEKVFDKLPAYLKEHRREILSSITDEQYEIIERENPTWQQAYHGADIVNHIYSFKKNYPEYNITIDDYWNWQNIRPDPIDIDKNEVVNPKFIEEICKKYPTYLVSNSSPTHLNFYLNELNIKNEWFVDIISNHFIEEDITKKHYYKDILTKEKCAPENAFVFGDSITSDLKPAEALGINTYHVTNATELESIVKKAIQSSYEKSQNQELC